MKTETDVKSFNHLSHNMYVYPKYARQVMTTKQVKETLLATDNFIMACGHGWKLKIQNIGAGMEEVTLQPF